MRHLATIKTIDEITPIPNADKIECARIGGWEIVISKADGFEVGDNVVYIEIDSIMPEKPEYEFLRQRKFRVRTVKLRGQVSQGLILPLTVLPNGNWKVGDDVTEILGVKKYDPEAEEEQKAAKNNERKSRNPIVRYLMRFKWFRKIYLKPNRSGKFPDWISKTDEERIQNMPELFERLKDEKIPLIVTEKVDGTSATYFLKREKGRFGRTTYDFGVCSRNLRILDNNGSHYWKVAEKYNLEYALKRLIRDEDYVVLQGEITGEGIQGNKYPSDDGFRFWAFNLITPTKKYNTLEMQEILTEGFSIFCVPIATTQFYVPETIHDLVDYVQGTSQISNREREGCVFRNMDKRISFKCINPNFLLKNDD